MILVNKSSQNWQRVIWQVILMFRGALGQQLYTSSTSNSAICHSKNSLAAVKYVHHVTLSHSSDQNGNLAV